MKFYLAIAMLVLLVSSVTADEEIAPSPYVASSLTGRYYFKMIPDPEARYSFEKGRGDAYRVTNQKTDQLLWSTTGWYSSQTYLSVDGEYLVRLGNWPRGREPSENHLAIAFYKAGKDIKSYNTQQLIKDKSKVKRTVSHYEFYQGNPHFMEEDVYLYYFYFN